MYYISLLSRLLFGPGYSVISSVIKLDVFLYLNQLQLKKGLCEGTNYT